MRCEHGVESLAGGGERAVDAAPRHHDRRRRQARLEDLVPAHQPPAARLQEAPDALREIGLCLGRVADSQSAQARLGRRRVAPLRLLDLVATHMDVRAGKKRHHLGEHVLDEREGRVLEVVDVGVDAPVRGHLGGRARDRGKLRVGHHRRARVARHLDLGDDGDAALGGVGHERTHRVLRVVAAVEARLAGRGIQVGLRGGTGGHAPRADLREARVLADLEPPRLVVGQVPVQHVQLVDRHPVDEGEDEFRRLEVARRVEHDAAPRKARRVVDRDRGNCRAALARRHQLPERGAAVREARVARRRDHHARGPRLEVVGLGPRIRVFHAPQPDGSLPGRAFAQPQPQAVAALDETGEVGGDAPGRSIARVGDDDGGGGHAELAREA